MLDVNFMRVLTLTSRLINDKQRSAVRNEAQRVTFRGRGERRAVRQTVRRSGRQLRKLLDRQTDGQSVRPSVLFTFFFCLVTAAF